MTYAQMPAHPMAIAPILYHVMAPQRMQRLSFSNLLAHMQLLDISQDADEATIKKAYKRAALKYHPDKAQNGIREEAEQRFKQLVEANEILSDSAKRRRYDAGWSAEEIEQGYQEGEGRPGMGGMGGMGGMDMEDLIFAAMFQRAQRSGGRV